MRLTIVSTLYNSQPFLEEFYRRVVAVAETLTNDFELLLVNDGSPDNVLDVAIGLHRRDPRVTIVDLSRNFGHHRAMMAGLSYARGDLIFLIDCDLEEPPEVLPQFYKRMIDEDCDVVYGIRKSRRDRRASDLSASIFYWVMAQTGGIDLPRNLSTVRLMSQRYVSSLIRHQEREVLIAGLWAITGFKQIPFEIARERSRHRTNYSIRSRMKLTIDYLTSFSPDLLYNVFYAGIGIFALSLASLVYLVMLRVIWGHPLAGWTSLIASIWMFGGLTVLLIGLVGIYIAHIFNETKGRPYVIVRDVISARPAATNEFDKPEKTY